jgi:hypothetical protein
MMMMSHEQTAAQNPTSKSRGKRCSSSATSMTEALREADKHQGTYETNAPKHLREWLADR